MTEAKPHLEAVVVVEGRRDAARVREAAEVDVFVLGGDALTPERSPPSGALPACGTSSS
ncbi:MAG: hypothetical protein KM312_05120 [Hydrogenibacillus schlegelii]|uniref:Uncharacterized protein n=1 Tax=Hydrogenibacillus schlegelii TaxID=1484 RepID=A0A947G7Y2_HYDSH|nr:hypothetical protein [Hydrogenibacillus schlegelii]